MPEFNFSPTPVALNPLMSAADLTAQQQGLQANALGIQAKQLQNQYTQAVQPAQINLLLQGLRGMSGQQPDPGPMPQQVPQQQGMQPSAVQQPQGDDQAGPTQAAFQPPQGGHSLFTGDTPQSADPQTQQLVGQIAARNGVNPDWAMRIHHAESGTSATPFGPGSTSSAGAIGPMQLEPGTAKDLGVDPNDLQQNITGGLAYLKTLKERYGSPVLATAAYNAGPGRVDDFLAGKGSLPTETVNYVGKVFGNGDGASLIGDALSGNHGSIPGHDSDMGTTMFKPPGTGMDSAPPEQDNPQARAATKRLVGMGQYYASLPGGTGARAAAQIQAQLDNIAGPGGIVDPNTGAVVKVPGSFATRYSASQAAEAGKSGPAAQLYAQNEGTRIGGEVSLAGVKGGIDTQVHRDNVAADVAGDKQKLVKIDPGQSLVDPSKVMAPSSAGPGQSLIAPMQPNGAAPNSAVYTAPPQPSVKAAEMDAARTGEIQQPIMDQAKESQNALNRIGQIRAAVKQSTEAGVPPGYFSPEMAQAAAAAKSLGINLKSLGIDPSAIQNEQVAREGLTQINGEILKRMFPQRITNADVTSFGANLANYGMDPSALEPVLNQAEQAARYDVTKADAMHAYSKAHGNLLGFENDFYPKNGYGPNLFDAIKSGTAPAPTQAAAPGAFDPDTHAKMAPGTRYTAPDGSVRIKR